MSSRLSIYSVTLAALLATSGCGTSLFGGGEDTAADETRSAEEIYADAERLRKNGDEDLAAQLYSEVERLYPYSDLVKSAMLGSAVSYFEGRAYDDAITSAERFIGFYPNDERTPYARFLIGESHYQQIVDVGRDQGRTNEALTAFRELIARHPDSEYAEDAQLKIDTALDQLAGKEMTIGRYYLKRGDYNGAINRFQNVVRQYDTTTHVKEALHRLVEANLAIGLTEEAKRAAAVLGSNYPGSDWYVSSYALLTGENLAPEGQADSWWRRAYRQVIKGEWL